MGTLKFLSVLKVCEAIVGNSSSGIIEAPSLGIATINIGERQKGRIQAESVVNSGVSAAEINAAFKQTRDQNFRARLPQVINPYGSGFVTQKIVEIIKAINLKEHFVKKFNNLT